MFNVDGTRNENGSITEFVSLTMRYKNHLKKVYFYVANIRKSDIIIGHNWLKKHNLEINWHTGEVTSNCCPSLCGQSRIEKLKEEA